MTPLITLSLLLQINDVRPNSLYQLIIQGLEFERIRLQAAEAAVNVFEYRESLKTIFEYQRILAILRGDTLNAIAGKLQPVN